MIYHVNTKHKKAGMHISILGKVDNRKVDKFLEKHNLPKPTQEDIENPNSLVFVEEIEFFIKNLSTKMIPRQDGLTNEL